MSFTDFPKFTVLYLMLVHAISAQEMRIPFELEKGGQVSMAIYEEDGKKMIRTLLTGKKLEAGKHEVAWEGVDRYGRPVEKGKYKWKVLVTPGFQSEYLTTIGTNPGTERWHDWVGNHAAPSSVACDGEKLHIGSMGENTPGGICTSLDGNLRHWDASNRFAWSGVRAAQFVGDQLVELHGFRLKAEVFVVNAETGAKLRSFDVSPKEVPKGLERLKFHMAVANNEVFVTYPDLSLVRVFDFESGKEKRKISGRKFVALATAGEIVLGLENNQIRELEGNWISKVKLENPVRLSYDPEHNLLWVAEGAPSHQIVLIDKTKDEVIRRLGRKGGRKFGKWSGRDFREINSIGSDHQGGLYIAEGGEGMRRVLRISQNGKLLNEWYGSQNFFNFSSPHPDHPNLVMFMSGHHSKAIVKVNYETGNWQVMYELDHPDFGGMFPQASHHSGQWQLVSRNGRLFAFCDRGSGPALMELDLESGKMTPIAAMGRVHWNPELAPKLWQEAVTAKGLEFKQAPKTWSWRDLNNDGDLDVEEIELLEIPLDGSRQVFLDEVTNLWMGSNDEKAAWLKFTNKGSPHRPNWDVANPVLGAGKLPQPLQSLPSIKGRGLWKDENGNIYRQIHANSNPAYSRPNLGWPTCYHGTSRMMKWSSVGELEWEIGRHAIRRPGNLYNPSEHQEFHDFTKIMGMYGSCIIAGDRVVRPAMAWTSDGLYAGDFFDRRPDDGLPDMVYKWWRDRDTNEDGPVPYDVLTAGSIYPDGEDRLLWFPMGEQNTPVYAVSGWKGWQRKEGLVEIQNKPRHAQATGSGLKARYQSDGGSFERVDRILWFQDRRETPHFLSWEKKSEIWEKLGNRAFRVKWEGMLEAPLSEDFIFSAINHGPENPTSGEYWHPEWGTVRVWLGGKLILEQTDPTVRTNKRPIIHPESAPQKLQAGARYPIRVEYVWTLLGEGKSKPEFSLLWDSPTQERQRIPTRFLYPDEAPKLPIVALDQHGEIQLKEGDLVKLKEKRVTLSGDGAKDVKLTKDGIQILKDQQTEGTETAIVSLNISDQYLVHPEKDQLVIRIEDEQVKVAEGRELHYLFTKQYGRKIRDASGKGQDLYIRDKLEWCEDGEGLQMNRNAARVDTHFTSDVVTVALRFKTELPNAGLTWARSNHGGLAMFLDNGILQVKDGYGNPISCEEGGNLADGKFHQITWTLHRNNGAYQVYIDGLLVKSNSPSKTREVQPMEQFLIGGAYGGGPFRYFIGTWDDYRIYSRELTRKEIVQLVE